MAITGVSAISGEQIIAAGALSAKEAATAAYTTGGGNLQGLYDTVSNNSGSWTGGPTYTGDAQGALDEVYTNSGTWNTVTDKLNTTAFSTVSGNFITAHQALPESANWNSTYDTVHDNSANWTGGGAATLPVSGSAGDNSAVYGLYDMKLEYNLPSVGGSEPDHAYTQIDTVSITLYESNDEDQSYNEISIRPSYIELYNPADGNAYIGAADVLSWQSTYNTVSDNSANWTGGGGGGYTGDAQGALDEVYTNSGTWNTVTGKLDTTAQVVTAVGTAMIGGGLWPSTTTYLVSSINGSAILPHGYSVLSGSSANWNSTYNTVRDNSASWTGGSDFTGLFQAQYGVTQYSDIKNAVDNHKVVYCQSGGRMAFLAYSGSNNYEFQYYRSLTGHTTAAQGDQVFVYTINNANNWSVTTRNTYTEIKPSAGLTSAFTNGTAAKLTFRVSDDIINATASVAANSANWQSAYDQLGNVTALLNSL